MGCNSGDEKDSLDHSATGHFIFFMEQQTTVQATIQESHENLCGDLNLQTSHLQSALLTTQLYTCYTKDMTNRSRIVSESNQ